MTRVTTHAVPNERQVGCNNLPGVHANSNFTYRRIKPTAFYDMLLHDDMRPQTRAPE